MSYSQFAASSQFYLYGTRHFNQNGYKRHLKENEEYKEDVSNVDLSSRVYMVTGANSGIGFQIAQFLASKGATVYMVCRSLGRAEKAQQQIIEATSNDKVFVLQVDCSLGASVQAGWEAFLEHQRGLGQEPRLDGLCCNAGVLLNEKQLTPEGIEVTFACHLLFGTYLLGDLCMPLLEANKGRVVIVASGGMYNTKFDWDKASGLAGEYNGNLVYAYAKRGQVLLAEQWAQRHPDVKVVSAHPGWTLTDAVDAAYGDQKKYLDPMRTPWEGAEGISWLFLTEWDNIQGGAFYLDRKPQVKHLAGPFFSEGSFTKNSPAEVEELMTNLENWAKGNRPAGEVLRDLHEAKIESTEARKAPAAPLQRHIDLQRFMGRWYVIGHIPTFFDKGTAQNTEDYVWNEDKQHIQVEFGYSNLANTKRSSISQTAKPTDEYNAVWKLSVKLGFIPLSFPYVIHDCAEDYSTCIVGEPKRSFLYLMARTPIISEDVYASMKASALRSGYNTDLVVQVPQDPALYPELN